MALGQLDDLHVEKNEGEPVTTLHRKTDLNWLMDLNLIYKTKKFLEANLVLKFHDSEFFWMSGGYK